MFELLAHPVLLLAFTSLAGGSSSCYQNPELQAGSWIGQGWSDAAWQPSSSECATEARFLRSASEHLDPACLQDGGRWTVFVGDSNMRKMFSALATRLEQQEGFTLRYADPDRASSDSRWSDREMLHVEATHEDKDLDFRMSFHFFRNLQEFKKTHMHNMSTSHGNWDFQNDYSSDGSVLNDEARPDYAQGLAQVLAHSHSVSSSLLELETVPDTLIFSTGLWAADEWKSSVPEILETLSKLKQRRPELRILYVTQGRIGSHPSITNDEEKGTKYARDLALRVIAGQHRKQADATRQVEVPARGGLRGNVLVDTSSESTANNSHLDVLDMWQMSSTAQTNWLNLGGGYHFTEKCDCAHAAGCTDAEWSDPPCDFANDQSPLSRAVLGYMWSYMGGKHEI